MTTKQPALTKQGNEYQYFTEEDDKKLVEATQNPKYQQKGDFQGIGFRIKWSQIAKEVFGGRFKGTKVQMHWGACLHPLRVKKEWNKEDDETLGRLVKEHGNKWTQISKEFGYVRSYLDCMNRARCLGYAFNQPAASASAATPNTEDDMTDADGESSATTTAAAAYAAALEGATAEGKDCLDNFFMLASFAQRNGGKPPAAKRNRKRKADAISTDAEDAQEADAATATAAEATPTASAAPLSASEQLDKLLAPPAMLAEWRITSLRQQDVAASKADQPPKAKKQRSAAAENAPKPFDSKQGLMQLKPIEVRTIQVTVYSSSDSDAQQQDISITTPQNFSQLLKLLVPAATPENSQDIQLQYRDSDGDWVTIADDNEWFLAKTDISLRGKSPTAELRVLGAVTVHASAQNDGESLDEESKQKRMKSTAQA